MLFHIQNTSTAALLYVCACDPSVCRIAENLWTIINCIEPIIIHTIINSTLVAKFARIELGCRLRIFSTMLQSSMPRQCALRAIFHIA